MNPPSSRRSPRACCDREAVSAGPLSSALILSLAATSVARPQAVALAPPPKHPLTVADALAVRIVSDPQISPDGAAVLYAVSTPDTAGNARTVGTVLASTAAGAAASRAFPDDTSHASEARWSPDGRRIAYVAGGRLWVADASGGGRHVVARLTGGAAGPVWSPTGDAIAFTSAVTPTCDTDACNADRAQARARRGVKVHAADQLMYRHWNEWDDSTRRHLFAVSPDGGLPRDLTAGARYDVPPGPIRRERGLRLLARRTRGRVRGQGPRARGRMVHRRQHLRRAGGRWPSDRDHRRQRGRGRSAGLLAGRSLLRVPLPSAGGLRVRSRAAHALRPCREEVDRAAAHVGPERRVVPVRARREVPAGGVHRGRAHEALPRVARGSTGRKGGRGGRATGDRLRAQQCRCHDRSRRAHDRLAPRCDRSSAGSVRGRAECWRTLERARRSRT